MRIPLRDRVNDTMEDIAFSDWPGQPVDLSGSNPWLPAYGFQPPTTLLDRDDFLGNPGRLWWHLKNAFSCDSGGDLVDI